MSNPRVQIDIVGNDQTAKATGSSEKRLKHLGGEAGKLDGKLKGIGSSKGGLGTLAKMFGQVESSASSAFGSRSVLSTITSRLGAVQKVGTAINSSMARTSASSMRTSAALGEVEAAGEGAATQLGETAAAGGVLEGAIAGVGTAAAATAGILVAAAAASFKLADGWSRGAASVGRTAELIGVAADKLQAFQGAAERVGVDKATAGAALGGLSQTLNDARYGRNNNAIAVLSRLGVQMKLGADGDVDVAAMLPAISDALKRQSSSGRRTAGGLLGISPGALAAFTQGRDALSKDMADYSRNGPMQSADDIALAKKLQRRDTIVAQSASKVANDLNRGNAHLVNGAGDLLVSGATVAAKAVEQIGALISPPAKQIDKGGRAIDHAASNLERSSEKLSTVASNLGAASSITRPGLTPQAIAAAQAAEKKWGLPASVSLAQYQVESSLGRHMPKGSNNPFGIKEFNPNRPRVWAMTSEFEHGKMIRKPQPFRVFPSINEAFDEHARMLMQARPYAAARRELPDVASFVRAVAPVYATDPDYRKKFERAEGNYRHFDGDQPIPVRVDVHLHGGRKGDHVIATAGHGKMPALSHAFNP